MVPVVDYNNNPLMPTKESRARKWCKSGKATYFWKKGIYCVRLNQEPSNRLMQTVVVGIDPGSKKEGFTVKTKKHTLLNIQADAVTWVKDAVETRRNARRARRQRKTPYRKCRLNRGCLKKQGRIPPSTKARWQWKLRILNYLAKLFPISDVVVEDIAAISKKGQKKWNKSFSPLEVGKNWFYDQISSKWKLYLMQGYETKGWRDELGLKKSKDKLSKSFDAHCVDSWVLANSVFGDMVQPDNKKILYLKPLQFHRRQLHVFVPAKGGKRRNYGGTISMVLKRGSLIKHSKYGLTHVGGSSKMDKKNWRISLNEVGSNERLTRYIKSEDCKFLTYCSWTWLY